MELTTRFLRQFGVVLAGLSAAVALWQFFYGHASLWPWLLIALVALLLAWLAPTWLRPLARGWMWIGHWLGFVNTRLLLGLVFFLVITPVSLLFRLIGRDALALKKKQANSYWQQQDKSWPPDDFKNQF